MEDTEEFQELFKKNLAEFFQNKDFVLERSGRMAFIRLQINDIGIFRNITGVLQPITSDQAIAEIKKSTKNQLVKEKETSEQLQEKNKFLKYAEGILEGK
jgi:hypothetical protein